ncbi:MAG: universal stress protein [Gammaproteobacteria bacterium]
MLCELAPDDGEAIAARAAQLAATPANLMLLSIAADSAPLSTADGDTAARLAALRERLEALAQRLGVTGCICCADGGAAVATILAHATEFRAELIVVGHRPRGALERVLDTTANAIVRHAPCDVLVVHTS